MGAYHRLTLSEGSKEKRKLVKKLRKIYLRIIAIAAIILTIALPMTMRNVAALGPSGHSYSKDTFVSSGYTLYPQYGECEHSHLYQNDDMMVGIGVYAYYDLNDQTPAFEYGNWWFGIQAGDNSSTTNNSPVQIHAPMIGTQCLDYGLGSQWYSNFYDYSSGTWTNGYYYNNQWVSLGYYASVDNDQMGQFFSDRASIEGTTQGVFYRTSAPTNYLYYWAYTQIPPQHSAPYPSYAFLTAHQSVDY